MTPALIMAKEKNKSTGFEDIHPNPAKIKIKSPIKPILMAENESNLDVGCEEIFWTVFSFNIC